MIFEVEHTDLFAGAANYSWVKRYEFEAPSGAGRRALVRRAKKLCGLTGARCSVSDYGQIIEIRPRGYNEVVFVSVKEAQA